MNSFDISGKVAVVTGASGVIGGALARGLAQAGAKVCLLGRNEEKLFQSQEKLGLVHENAMIAVADVLNASELEAARSQIVSKWGKIDILLNVAGGNLKGATIGPNQSFFDLSIEDFDHVVALNLKGSVLPTLVFSKEMANQKQGSIINISSMAASRPFTRVVGYAAAKAGIDNFTKWLSVEMAKKISAGIRVNAIAPGVFVGEQNYALLFNPDQSLTDRGKLIIQHTPMARFGEPDELIGTAIWLASDASKFVTGIVVPVDGGFSAFSGV